MEGKALQDITVFIVVESLELMSYIFGQCGEEVERRIRSKR